LTQIAAPGERIPRFLLNFPLFFYDHLGFVDAFRVPTTEDEFGLLIIQMTQLLRKCLTFLEPKVPAVDLVLLILAITFMPVHNFRKCQIILSKQTISLWNEPCQMLES
jgi:hypothetical protein